MSIKLVNDRAAASVAKSLRGSQPTSHALPVQGVCITKRLSQISFLSPNDETEQRNENDWEQHKRPGDIEQQCEAHIQSAQPNVHRIA